MQNKLFTGKILIRMITVTAVGGVSNLTGEPTLTSILLTWSAPQEPNGVLSYEVTYRVSDGDLVSTNTTHLMFTISALTPGINVTEISVTAYSSMGQGYTTLISHLMTLREPRKLANRCEFKCSHYNHIFQPW